ncbi:unnamed protein product [Cylicocyclus nassatus]|uniref:Uncharacterized protein n=1 Tax=Cylicocyclus nassatus TaxID=53992 RepID=A0AA36GN46_CYLNA|nr:unnamed protein product [Cylicocyclus nassatus]
MTKIDERGSDENTPMDTVVAKKNNERVTVKELNRLISDVQECPSQAESNWYVVSNTRWSKILDVEVTKLIVNLQLMTGMYSSEDEEYTPNYLNLSSPFLDKEDVDKENVPSGSSIGTPSSSQANVPSSS